VTLEVRPGEIHALLGGNGSGKSTLIKVLAGVERADAGTIEVDGQAHDLDRWTPARARDARLRFVHQQPSTLPDLSVAENLAVGHGFATGPTRRIHWAAQRRRAADVLERFRVDALPDARLGTLGPARQKMVAIARALQDQDGERRGILVLDEPTAALPEREADLLLEALRGYAARGQTIVYVSHRLEEILRVASRASVLRDGRVAGTCDRHDLGHDRLVELIVGHMDAGIQRGKARRSAGAPLLSLEGLAAGAARDATLSVRAGEIVGVAGLLGSGRSSLLRSVFGAVPRSGVVRVGSTVVAPGDIGAAIAAGIALLPEDRAAEAAFMDLSVADNLSAACIARYWRGLRLRHRRERIEALRLIDEYAIKAPSSGAPLATLSGGNQQKVMLARWMRREPLVLLLDEPTQGVDVGARTEIHRLIRRAVDGGAGALVVSSDLEELAGLADRAVVLVEGRTTCELPTGEHSAHRLGRLVHATTTGV
jgi:ribose transport system ATP-binding protein